MSSNPAAPILSTSPSGADSPGFDPVDNGPGPSGSTPSSGDTAAVKLDKAALKDIARQLVLVASGYVHNVLARDDAEKAADLWIAEDNDQAQIGDPLASIVNRHSGAAAMSQDVADLVMSCVGLVAWGVRNAGDAWKIRRRARRQLSPPPAAPMFGDPA